jgi:hypothetical protein
MQMNRLLIGNIISLAAACFTLASAWSGERKRIYLYQAVQCLLLSVANIFFFSISGVTTFVLCAIRNLLLARDRFTGKLCVVFVVSVAVVGIIANNRGVVGFLPIVTTALYTVVCLFAKRKKAVKWNIVVNLSLWAVYDLLISDYVSCAVDTGSAAAALISMARDRKDPADPVTDL